MASNPESKTPQDTEVLGSTVTTPRTKLNVKRGRRRRRSSGDNLNSEMGVSIFKTTLCLTVTIHFDKYDKCFGRDKIG